MGKYFFVIAIIWTASLSAQTTGPFDPYSPLPLRVGTMGADVYHRPFCPFAKRAIALHGLAKRINFWTREQVDNSNRSGDAYCRAAIFDCSDIQPSEFATSNNDPWCGANIRQSNLLDTVIANKTLCSIQGHIGIFVDSPEDCIDGAIRSSGANCDQAACSVCRSDCEAVCNDCVRGTLAILNKATLKMGDATGDGEVNVDDYLFFHECFDVATPPCQNVFDFDADSDVDESDFELLVTDYNSGNESWTQTNFPDADINPSKPELPLRVGTDGSAIYHRIWCPAVNNSWQTWGIDRRADFYSWDQIESSGRAPDTNICLPGTRDNPSP